MRGVGPVLEYGYKRGVVHYALRGGNGTFCGVDYFREGMPPIGERRKDAKTCQVCAAVMRGVVMSLEPLRKVKVFGGIKWHYMRREDDTTFCGQYPTKPTRYDELCPQVCRACLKVAVRMNGGR